MRTIELQPGQTLQASQLPRQGVLPASVMASAQAIVDTVKQEGDAALRRYCRDFDKVEVEDFRFPQEKLDRALDQADPEYVEALQKAADQIRDFHQRQVRQSWMNTKPDGTILGVKFTPVDSAGVYVPGGRAQYPSTVLMDVIPAKVAGVERIVMVTPPQSDGGISAATLAAAKVAGVDEIYTVGGAQAIAALAYGTESIPNVSVIVGPGNAYVAAAKHIVSGDVGIDMVAGPSEVCVLVDGPADATIVAADLMAQAEHDPMAACYLVCTDGDFAAQVCSRIDAMVAQSPRAQITQASFDGQGTIVVCPDLDTACKSVDTIAPEHLELHAPDAMALLGKIHNAGAIFVGDWSSEPLGDYVAGPNHTLPTGGTALFSNPLGVDDFVKQSSVVCYTPAGLLNDAPATQIMAQHEGLWAHALSVGLRRNLLEQGMESYDGVDPAQMDLTAIAWPPYKK